MKKLLTPILAATAMLAYGGAASASILVLGDSKAEACYKTVFYGNQGSRTAIEKCSDALDNPMLSIRNRAATHVNRGLLHMRKGNYEKAKVDMEEAIDIRKNIPEAYINYSGILYYLGEYESALDVANNVLNTMETDKRAQALYNRSLIFHSIGDYKSAYYDLKEVLEIKPDWVLAQEAISQYDVRRKAGA